MSIPAIHADAFQAMHKDVYKFLFDLTAIPSVSNDELEACEFTYEQFCKIPGVVVEKQFLDNSIRQDPYWRTGPYHVTEYEGHFNVIATWKSDAAEKQPPVYLNAHIDTIMACGDNLMPPTAGDDNDTIYGLGVHDDKGHVAIVYGLYRYLSDNDIKLPFDVIAHLVVEEEIGGNGSLWAVRHAQEKGQCALMLDGNEGLLMHQCRGSVWPLITCTGVSCHPGDRKKNAFASAYDFLKRAISVIEASHAEYCAWLKENPVKYFEDEVPPLNIGMIHAGNWPSTLPTTASAQMVVGVFPSSPDANAIARKRIEDALAADPDLAGHYTCEFIFDVMSGGTEADDPLVTDFHNAMVEAGLPGTIGVFNAACDIGFYSHLMGVPAINAGVGAKNAHSLYESIKVSEILQMSHAIMVFLKGRAEA